MNCVLGIDSSNYTSSAAVYNIESGGITQSKMLLPVKKGALGLRQSDAVFEHTRQLPAVIAEVLEKTDGKIIAVGASVSPRREKGSYMPCFLSGAGMARSISSALKIPLYAFSHQEGHIAAGIYSLKDYGLFDKKFFAFHVSGGTTELLLVNPDKDGLFKVSKIYESLDLKAGQAVDRVGKSLGFSFPAGPELDICAQNSDRIFKINPSIKDGNCSLSGLENKCASMLDRGESKSDISKFCVDYIAEALLTMSRLAIKEYGNLPILFIGGVMSNTIIRKRIEAELDAKFASPEYSCDNAAGTALLTYKALGIKTYEFTSFDGYTA